VENTYFSVRDAEAAGSNPAFPTNDADGAIVVSNGKDLDLNGQIAVLEARVPDEVWMFEP